LARAGQIDVRHTVGKCQLAIAGETVEHEREPLIAFDIARTFEEFIEHAANQILGRRDITRRRHLIRKLSGDETVVICEVDIEFHV